MAHGGRIMPIITTNLKITTGLTLARRTLHAKCTTWALHLIIGSNLRVDLKLGEEQLTLIIFTSIY